MYSVEDRRDAKREWRKSVNMKVNRPSCCSCRLWNKMDSGSLVGFCWKMAHDLGIEINHCRADATSICDEHIPN